LLFPDEDFGRKKMPLNPPPMAPMLIPADIFRDNDVVVFVDGALPL